MTEKSRKKKKSQLPFRINVLFFVVFLLFSILILQLGVVQILNGSNFQKEIERTRLDTSSIPVPRGKIYDSNNIVIVDNEPVYSITYTPEKGVQAKERLDIAKKLSRFISMVPVEESNPETYYDSELSERNLKEYWYLENKDEADSRLPDDEREKLSNVEAYNKTLDLITTEEINSLTLQEKEIIAIKKELDKAYSLTPQIVKNKGVTAEEYAKVSEHLNELPGINATTDWNRGYPYRDTLRSLLGSITTQEEGIPAENEEYYLTRGYSRNDRVGTSGLEDYYEEVLRGRKEQKQYTTTKDGVVIGSDTVVEGYHGKDLVLTIDIKFQEAVDNIVQEELLTAINKHPYANRFLTDALVVVVNPKTGEILAVSGQRYLRDKNEFSNEAFRTLYDAHRPGSAIKGATVLAGYDSGVIKPGQSFYDRPIKIAGTPEKSSYSNLGLVNDYDALKLSSNVYMFYIALRMGGEYRYPFPNGSTVSINHLAFQTFRKYFSQFGLGIETGIDYPYEATGFVGTEPKAGNLMDFAIGQYDTYTTMQLVQYISTIANGGYRVKPYFVKEIRNHNVTEDKPGSISRTVNTSVLNKIDMNHIERVQEGFRRVFQESRGTASKYFADKKYKPAGKTGTAQSDYFNPNDGSLHKTENRTLVGYAPFNDPEVAFAIVVPNMGANIKKQHPINNLIGERILDTYFEMKKRDVDEN
ncbi:peptidoglycan D,D-transpeptidase FtsI family protein [Oceanobacillus halophilus]|uniref:serine-type D-Ala-D-Ala carboxypeptidase n=1 Tax=Oceanobacillus halophilus TaxID=930130 RepID=A0A495ACV2_9BACI|nr:penicillin-binding protein 2 [Oceanobacillus halophilus]RKQ37799.1 penicillin-binding protein 2 [Oceanobacillus halophilus]